jgi:hypothetical protein
MSITWTLASYHPAKSTRIACGRCTAESRTAEGVRTGLGLIARHVGPGWEHHRRVRDGAERNMLG